ncbi:MAG: hypothetical protein ACI9CF_000169 [Candidatus Omnitrophota bacterium]|jgi:hypothetical protein
MVFFNPSIHQSLYAGEPKENRPRQDVLRPVGHNPNYKQPVKFDSQVWLGLVLINTYYHFRTYPLIWGTAHYFNLVVLVPDFPIRTPNAGSEWAMNKEPMLRAGRVSEAPRREPAETGLFTSCWAQSKLQTASQI